MASMRICWQSFLDAESNASYFTRLAAYLNSIASDGVSVDVWGIEPPDHDISRLSEFRCAVLAVDNGLEAEKRGYDAYVMGHFQDPGLFELRSAVRMPVVGVGESTFYAALQIGRRIGLVTLHPNFEVWHLEQADRYGIGGRIAGVTGIGCRPEDFATAFAGDEIARQRIKADFIACAEPLVDAGADVVVPAGVLPGLLLSQETGLVIRHAPVVNCAAIALKSAEMWVQLRRLDAIEPSRGPSFALPSSRTRDDFRALVMKSRGTPQ